MSFRNAIESLVITAAALVFSLLVFGAFMYVYAKVPPDQLYYWIYMGGFGSRFSWQNTLTRAAPLILTALCTALPARLGMIVIGGEGALVLGGLAAVLTGLLCGSAPAAVAQLAMALAAMLVGGGMIALVGLMSHGRGVNATISSLLLAYIAIAVFNFAVENPVLRDPASLNKPSTYPIDDSIKIGNMPGMDVHWGLAYGIVFCVVMYVLMEHTTFGFAARMAGGNIRAAQASGLPVGWLVVIVCALGGAAAGLAGMVEIGAVHGQANAAIIAGYGFTGILVSFIARHHPLGIIPAAILFGGLNASSGVLQRWLKVPDASVQVLMGIMFVSILGFETLYGRLRLFTPTEVRKVAVA
ncbi:ABC transporter permease [Planctomycetaceae bacterium SCGC AG-212-D15]|nr:ABC transporter permease [Planctomycetaceae bacterium SCGC AG-212-D15]